ncbi:MAG: large conductance mechanosensitive channel protein MscL [Ruminococcus flavefaciens]|nr:large conductance mechanosensitive channel protein MscL [Ruminococcus flavefaciens]MCM1229484.1 large conductance mechanosensitive channel protein MscL [Ruminococcus flavefaciens]
MKKLLEEFKAFILRGNIIDMAIGVIVGGAFSNLVTSLLDNIISPILGFFNYGGFKGLHFTLWKADIYYGAFINDIINFVIMAAVVFIMMKLVTMLMNALHKKEAEKPAEPPKPTQEELLLTEIRDLLKAQASEKAE